MAGHLGRGHSRSQGKDYGAEAGPDSGNLLMAEGSYSFKDAAGICASRKLSK